MNRNSFHTVTLSSIATLSLATASLTQAQSAANIQIEFDSCDGTTEQRTRSTERGVTRFQVKPSGQVRGRANTVTQVFELSMLAPGASRWTVYRSKAMALLRPSRDVYVLTASLMVNNALMNYTLTLRSAGVQLSTLVATDATGDTLYRGTCRWKTTSGRLP